MPEASDFVVASCQATLFTPEAELSSARFVARFLPRWAEMFDGDPVLLPFPEGLPNEVPKIVLQSANSQWRCEVAAGRINLFWRKTSIDMASIQIAAFYETAVRLLSEYSDFLGSRVGRLAAVVGRYALTEAPGPYLAAHFSKERLLQPGAPFDRPGHFEVHAHKQYTLAEEFAVNSWVRNKSAQLTGELGEQAVVLVEHDLNTVAGDGHAFTQEQIGRYFRAVSAAVDQILELYYPEEGS